MGLNLSGIVGGITTGFTTLAETGNPYVAAGAGLLGALTGNNGGNTAGNLAGGLGNGVMGALDAQNEAFQVATYAQELGHQEQMQMQSEAFDQMMDEKSEQMREVNTLRDVQMAQRKADNGITKKFIESITE